MKLLVIRHAKAEDDHPEGDTERALTPTGLEKFRRAARGLAQLLPGLDVLASSPLRRARQTAGLIAEQYPGLTVTELPLLASGMSTRDLLPWLEEQPADACVAIVGHEPDLSLLITQLLTTRSNTFLSMKKGAMCLLAFDGQVAAGAAQLEWLLTAGQLRRMKGGK